MKSWPEQDAEARFNALLGACEREGPQGPTKPEEGGRRPTRRGRGQKHNCWAAALKVLSVK